MIFIQFCRININLPSNSESNQVHASKGKAKYIFVGQGVDVFQEIMTFEAKEGALSNIFKVNAEITGMTPSF